MTLSKNQLIRLKIDAMSHEGEGIGRWEGMAVFVPRTAIGDVVEAKVVKVLKNRAYAIVDEMVVPSPHRVENDCPVYRRCGGCTLRHISYAHELEVKAGWVGENLRRLGGVDIAPDTIISPSRHDRYRNKAQFPVQRLDGRCRTGFYAKRSHALVPVEDCLLQPAFFAGIQAAFLEYMEQFGLAPYDERTHKGTVRHLYLRYGEATGQVMVCVVAARSKLPGEPQLVEHLRAACPSLSTVVINVNKGRDNVILGKDSRPIFGDGFIEDILCGIGLRLSPHSFYQVNREGAELLYRRALEYADPREEDTVLDLYCGAGSIGLSMAHRAREIVGVEVVSQAVEDARENAARNNIANARFLCGDAADGAALLQREGLTPDIVVVDPPRKGLDEAVVAHVAAMKPRRIVYISCNSATLARDCKLFAGLGYRVTRCTPVDLFPRTTHVEAVCLLEGDHPQP